ncbi:uncharacterized protein EDB91DRAFT_1159031 [Suillus paluster]|uniref:uncharacterized protein n=1 Tax=Suillus paluster TaxID=48578 RepID=UPI001B87FD0E|nr:uncharacterized protein EDB91DRAFT_1159031 [Suillus paluster]KAG1729632.1 hypothetical protein EDB91DRAFT_1159031 [Suillus paluster]
MFASRSVMFALLSFLAGVNACIQCPATVGGFKLSSATVLVANIIQCTYPTLHCWFRYNTADKMAGDPRCPSFAIINRRSPPEYGLCPNGTPL